MRRQNQHSRARPPVEHYVVGENLLRLVRAITPPWNGHNGRRKTLAELWDFYDEPYGHEVEVNVEDGSRTLVLVPYLSAVRLVWNERTKLPDAGSSSSSRSDSEDEGPARSRAPGSAMSYNQPTLEKSFQFFAEGPPYRRTPLSQHAREIGKKCPEIWNMPLDYFHAEKSWFAVSWHPVVVSGHDHATGIFRGYFLTYHRLRPSATPWMEAAHLFKHLPSLDDHYDGPSSCDEKWSRGGFVEMLGFVGFGIRLRTWYSLDDKKGHPSKPVSIVSSYRAVVELLELERITHFNTHPDFAFMLKENHSFRGLVHAAYGWMYVESRQYHRRKNRIPRSNSLQIHPRYHQNERQQSLQKGIFRRNAGPWSYRQERRGTKKRSNSGYRERKPSDTSHLEVVTKIRHSREESPASHKKYLPQSSHSFAGTTDASSAQSTIEFGSHFSGSTGSSPQRPTTPREEVEEVVRPPSRLKPGPSLHQVDNRPKHSSATISQRDRDLINSHTPTATPNG